MEFKTNKPIYQQIVDFCFSKILTREWRAEERVVSVRELSTQLAVNSRTVMKAYEYLQAEDIIYPERGMGFYLAKDAVKKVMKIQKILICGVQMQVCMNKIFRMIKIEMRKII